MNKSLPKVSIILPTYNGSQYIRQAIENCLKQTFKNIELIIVDDASSDKTSQIIRAFKDKRIKYLRHKQNKGLPYALNTGFAKAIGDYLTWTSDDNYYARKAIEEMFSFLRKKKCLFVYCNYYQFKNKDIADKKIIRLPEIFIPEKSNTVGPCFLYSKKVMEITGKYDPETALAEDYDYWIRVSRNFNLCHLKKPLYFYRYHPFSLTRQRLEEAKVVNFLVRLKNNVCDIEQVAALFINFIAQKKKGFFELNKILVKILFLSKIRKTLKDYKRKKIDFLTARLKLEKIIEEI